MSDRLTVVVVSDIHYGGAAEKKRGWREEDYISNGALRLALRAYRHFIWRRDVFAHNSLLDRFLAEAADADLIVANGDFSCDTAFIGVADDAASQSAGECLDKLRSHFGLRFHATIGDHELGKRSLFGGVGGMRLASWRRATRELELEPFWKIGLGENLLIGMTSSLVALPAYLPETLPEERSEWERLRREQMEQIRSAFESLRPQERVILFCHDPTALPFLWREAVVQSKAHQIVLTIIGHLHSRLFLWQSRILSGMPTVSALGYSIQRMSAALSDGRFWKPFRVQFCPALAGIQLLKDGGYCSFELGSNGPSPLNWHFHPLPWETAGTR